MITGNKRKRFSVLLIRLGGEFIWGTDGIYISAEMSHKFINL